MLKKRFTYKAGWGISFFCVAFLLFMLIAGGRSYQGAFPGEDDIVVHMQGDDGQPEFIAFHKVNTEHHYRCRSRNRRHYYLHSKNNNKKYLSPGLAESADYLAAGLPYGGTPTLVYRNCDHASKPFYYTQLHRCTLF